MHRRREHGDPDETFTKRDDGVGVSPIAVGGDDCGGSSDTVRPEDLQNVPGPAGVVEHDDGARAGIVADRASSDTAGTGATACTNGSTSSDGGGGGRSAHHAPHAAAATATSPPSRLTGRTPSRSASSAGARRQENSG